MSAISDFVHFLKMLNDAKVASLGFLISMIQTYKNHWEQLRVLSVQGSPLRLLDYYENVPQKVINLWYPCLFV